MVIESPVKKISNTKYFKRNLCKYGSNSRALNSEKRIDLNELNMHDVCVKVNTHFNFHKRDGHKLPKKLFLRKN